MQLDSCKGSSQVRRRAELEAVVIVTIPHSLSLLRTAVRLLGLI